MRPSHFECRLLTRIAVGRATVHRDTTILGPPDAKAVCCALFELLEELHGALSHDALRSWGINRSEDLGKVVYEMVDDGQILAHENDSIDDFDDLFDLSDPPEQWPITWM